MAGRGLLMPSLHLRTTTTSLLPMSFLPLISHRKVSYAGHARSRFFCSCSPAVVETSDMSNYRDTFAKRMAMAGLRPHHRIAIAVSGGPDSIALCILTAGWKTDNNDFCTNGRSKPVDSLLAIVVDHGLRQESAEEARLVYNRVMDMGIKCEVACCEWVEGKPQLGHLQEAARNKRYEILQSICIEQQIGILLVAHHADDQAELFVLRLSRNSGVLGLAGMASTSQIFTNSPDFSGEGIEAHGILLVRPLLEFSKEDLYNVCRCGNQKWVEDPTNRSQLFARNRIRMSLSKLSSSIFRSELEAVIFGCRRTRLHVDEICQLMMNQAVTVVQHGYAVIDLATLHSMDIKDIFLAKFVALVLQFVSQRHKPVRGNALKLLLQYLHTFPCKTSLTVASCYLCPAPGSKGTKVLVCCAVNSSLPLKMELLSANPYERKNRFAASELQEILADSRAYLNKSVSGASDVPFPDATSSESVLLEAKRLGLLSDSTFKSIVALQKEESEIFKPKDENILEYVSKDVKVLGGTQSKLFYPGQVGYFMDRFLLYWKPCNLTSYNPTTENEFVSNNELGNERKCIFCSSITGGEMVAEVRNMVDADWIYLSDLSKRTNLGNSQPHHHLAAEAEKIPGTIVSCLDNAVLSAQRALVSLKSIPVAARRALPVIVNARGIPLSIPSICFTHCSRLTISAVFSPRIPLGGGHSSFL